MPLEIDDINIGGFLSASSVSATTIVYNGQPIQNVFIQNVAGGYLPISGGTVTGQTIFSSGLSANTFNSEGQVRVGGKLFVIQDANFDGSISATTYYGDGSNLTGIVAGSSTYVQPGSNITTGGTASSPIISVVGSPSFNNLNISGLTYSSSDATFVRLSGTSIFVGNSTTGGTIQAEKELILQQTGDTFGSSILRLRNRNGENGAIFETTNTGITLIDFIFRTALNQRNIRYEARDNDSFLTAPEFQFGQAANPNLVVSDDSVLVRGSGGIRASSLSSTTISANTINVSGQLTGNDGAIFTSLSGTNIFSGSTNLNNYFNQDRAQINTKANLSGATFTGQVNATNLFSTSLSGTNIFSGSTNLSTVISNAVANVSVYSGGAKHFYGYYSGANISITAGWTDINISSTILEDSSFYSHTGTSAEVFVLQSGVYDILGRVTVANNTNNNTSTAEAKIQINTGGGYTDLLGSNGFAIIDPGSSTTNIRNETIFVSGKFTLPANSRIKIQAQRSNGTGTLAVTNGGTNIMITRF